MKNFLQIGRLAVVLWLYFLAALTVWSTMYRNHVFDITFPLERNSGYQYQQGWHDCRDSCTRAHRATDLYAVPGTPVYAIASGTIGWRRTSADSAWSPTSGAGYSLYINTPNNTHRHFYGHFGPDIPGREDEAFAVNPATGELWKVGDFVQRGQLLGYVGTSGATASGPHLHLEIRSMSRIFPLDDPGDDAIPGRSYGNSNATIGSFTFLRYDPWYSLRAAEERGDFPGPPPSFTEGDWVRVSGVGTALNVRGPEPCDDPIAGAAKPNGSVGRVIGGPGRCDFTSFDMWLIRWGDCTLGWSSERFLEAASEPDEICREGFFTLTVNADGEGTVHREPEAEDYAPGSTVTLTAIPTDLFDFTGWTGDREEADNPLVVEMDDDLEITARFRRTFEAWRRARFDEAELAAGAGDPEADSLGIGLPNLAVFVFALGEPPADRSRLPRIERNGDDWELVFSRLKQSSGVSQVVEISQDLIDWTALEPEEGGWTVEEGDDGTKEIVRARLPVDAEGIRGYARLRLSLEGP